MPDGSVKVASILNQSMSRTRSNKDGQHEELVRQAQAGNERAYELLVILHQSRLAILVRRYFPGDEDTVSDVMQEVFLKAWRSLRTFRGNSRFYTWLYSIAVNVSRNYLSDRARKHKREVYIGDDAMEEIEDPAWQTLPEHHYQQSNQRAYILAAIDGLPVTIREAFCLREEGFNYKDIARMTDCPVNTVKTRVFRGRAMLAAKLEAVATPSSSGGGAVKISPPDKPSSPVDIRGKQT